MAGENGRAVARWLRVTLLASVLGLTACEDAPAGNVTPCASGTSWACTCAGGVAGTQSCVAGVVQPCSCAGSLDAGSDLSGNADTTGDDGSSSAPDSNAPTACKSDKDCTGAGLVCDPLTNVCVACLTDSDCGPSQHCVGRVCQGFTPCNNSLGCTEAIGPDGAEQPICDKAIGECSTCLSDADCPSSHDCLGKACVPYTTCKNSKDCSGDTVCNLTTSRCVQCLGNNDCTEGQLCEAGTCRSFVACNSDKQCTPLGLLCDQQRGKCAQCLQNSDCPAIYHCTNTGVANTGVCTLDVCAQGQGACNNNAKVVCNAAGTGFGSPVACPAQTVCVASNGSPTCVALACTPGIACSGSKVVECSADGLTVLASNDCAVQGKKCSAGKCVTEVCQPSALYCEGNSVYQCAADGSSSTLKQFCGEGAVCQNGGCAPLLCAPGKPACTNNKPATCNATGTGYVSIQASCPADKPCVAETGQCKSVVCGDGLCESIEQSSCSADCGCPPPYTMPGTNPGCSGSLDKSYLNALASSSSASKGFDDVIRNCTLNKGCLAKTCESEKVDCIAKCVQTDVQNNLSYQCSYCHAQFDGYCGFKKCLSVCATNTPDCAPCMAQNCDAKLAACIATGANPAL